MVRRLGLEAGEKLIVELIDDHIALMPQPESWTQSVMGSARGVYGSIKEEMDAYIAGERVSPERWEWRQRFDDLVATDEAVGAVVKALRSYLNQTTDTDELRRHPAVREKRLDSGDINEVLDKLVDHGSVRRIHLDGPVLRKYRLVREFAKA
jgi:hypothetical protein